MASQRATLPGDMNSKVDSVDLVEADGEPQSPLAPLTPRVIPDNVLITLSALHAPESFPYPERRIHLDRINKSVKIGRTSKRVEELAADVKNGWFDSPVMSRDHAEIFVDWFYSKVYIKDIGSLHGTFRNQDKVKPGFPQALAPGDILKFGVDIQRASDLFPPCTTRVDIEFGTQGERPSENQTPTVFQVPDDTDSDRDTSSEEEDDNIRTSLEILRRSGIRRAPRAWVSTKDFVDLTQALPEEEVFDNGADTTLAEPEITAVEAVLPSSTPAGVENPWVRSFVDYGENFPSLDLTPPHDVEVAEEEEETTTSNFGQLEPRGFDASDELISNCDRLSLHEDEHFSMDSYPDDDDEISDASHEQSDLSSGYEDSDAIRLSESVSSDDDEDSESEEEGEDRSRDNSYLGIHNTEGSIAGEEPSGAPYVDDWNNEEISTFNQVESMAGKEPPTCQTTPDQPANSHEPVPQPWTENSSFASRDDACRLGSILNPWVVMPPYRPPVTEGPFACPATYQGQPAPMLSAVAGDMGEKTGKYDFFAARAANKATVGHQKQRGPLPPISEISPPLPPSPFTNMASTVKPLDATIKSQPSTETKTANNQTATESAWSASGDKFLNSPPEEPLNSTEQSTSPELDMGSAYLFQKSKIAAETQNSSDTDTTEATNVIDSVIPSKGKSSEPQTGQPRKRKAEEISTVDANEEIKDKDEGKCGQISKRNRGVAQSLGYFALGGAAAGVAFLSTLIATAPTLT